MAAVAHAIPSNLPTTCQRAHFALRRCSRALGISNSLVPNPGIGLVVRRALVHSVVVSPYLGLRGGGRFNASLACSTKCAWI